MTESAITPHMNSEESLQELLLREFNTEDQQRFVMHFHLYLTHGRDASKYVIDLDTVWEWLGFATKQTAKRKLFKTFRQDTDFIVTNLSNPEVTQVHGGHIKERIMLNVNTFKGMGMTANTERGKQSRAYYIKMEDIFIKHCEQQNTLMIEQMKVNFESQLEMERHKALVKAYDKTSLVYFLKVICPHVKGGYILIKIGKTNDITDRILKLTSMFGCPVVVLHVYPCEDNEGFERFLFKHHKIAPLKHTELIGENQVKSTECFLVKTEFVLNMIKRVLDKHVLYYKTKNKGDILAENERTRLQLHTSLTQMFNGNPEGLLKALELMQLTDQTNNEQENSCEKSDEEATDEHSELEDDEPSLQQLCGPKVQLYDAVDTSRLIQVFDGITEATRKIEKSSYTAIKFAAKNNLVYLGFRWFLIDRNDAEPTKPRDIGVTMTSRQRNIGFIAMMDLDKTKVIKVFATQREASQHISQHDSAMSTAVKFGKPLSGYFWAHWQLLDPKKQEDYLKTSKLPVPDTKPRGVSVQQMDPETGEVVETHLSITDVVKKFKMSPKTIKRVVLEETTYNGFKWKFCG